MKLFTVRLGEDERAKLEVHRRVMGLRSQADVIRHWIAGEPYPLVGPLVRPITSRVELADEVLTAKLKMAQQLATDASIKDSVAYRDELMTEALKAPPPKPLTMPRAPVGSRLKTGKGKA